MIVVTGSEGLIGQNLIRSLNLNGLRCVGIDTRKSTIGPAGLQYDILDKKHIREVIEKAEGIIHLAAVSRVIDGERNPDLCKTINIDGTENIINMAKQSNKNPWAIYGSSREVYGEANDFPVTENEPLSPVNIYGRTKVEAEKIIQTYSKNANVCILRFSNVYGDVVYDHHDRVVPAFAKTSASGGEIRIDGHMNSFDFTYINDVIRGIAACIEKVKQQSLDPIHFVSGEQTTLGDLADYACEISDHTIKINEAASRDYDVSKFVGSCKRAETVLNWVPTVFIRDGFQILQAQYKKVIV